MVVVAVSDPEAPVIVTVDVPTVAVELAVNVTTLDPVVGFVPKEAVTPVGSPDAARVILPANGLTSATEIVSVPLAPSTTDNVDAEGFSVKLPALVVAAGDAVDSERCRSRIGNIVPGSVESHAAITSSGGNAAVVALVLYRYICAALGLDAVPEFRYRLPVGKAPGQCPIGYRGGSRIVDGDRGAKPARPLAADCIDNAAGGLSGGARSSNKLERVPRVLISTRSTGE